MYKISHRNSKRLLIKQQIIYWGYFFAAPGRPELLPPLLTIFLRMQRHDSISTSIQNLLSLQFIPTRYIRKVF